MGLADDRGALRVPLTLGETTAMNAVERKAAAVAVSEWLTEYAGEEVASFWVWERTPMPIGLPSDEQLAEGLKWVLQAAIKTGSPVSPSP